MHNTKGYQKLPPAWLINAINAFRTFLIRLNRNLFPGNVVLYEQFQNFWLLPSLYVAAKLDIAATLKNKPLTAAEIAGQLRVDPANLSRIMRALSSQGIFKQLRDGRFSLNSMSNGLLEGPGSLRHMILHHLGPVNWNLMSNLEHAVRTGNDAFSDKYGKPTYDYLLDHPEEYALFDRSMSDLSELSLSPLLNVYDFSRFAQICDIGGGEGFLLANILRYNPTCRGVLFDTAEALEKAPEMLAIHGTGSRTSVIAGNFFESVPSGCDLYILKNIIHNWGDPLSVEILRKIHRGMASNGRLVIIEMVVPDHDQPSLSKLLDIQMMATMAGGRERTRSEYAALLEQSGFTLTRIILTIAPLCLIEGGKKG